MLKLVKGIGLVSIFVAICTNSALAGPRKLPDQTVQTPVGNFRIVDLRCNHLLGSVYVWGTVVNETGRSWTDLLLGMEFRDKNGAMTPKSRNGAINKIGGKQVSDADLRDVDSLHLQNVPAAGVVTFHYQASAKADATSLEIIFKRAEGSFPLKYRLALTKPMPSEALAFSDTAVSVVFSQEDTGLGFRLENNTDSPVKIDWNTVAFVSPSGSSQGVIHNGVRLADRGALKAPTVVPPHANVEDQIVPVGNVEMVSTEWVTRPLLPTGPVGLGWVGREFTVFMPLEIGGVTKNYSFVFRVVSAD